MKQKTLIYALGTFVAYELIAWKVNGNAVANGLTPTLPLDLIGQNFGYSTPTTTAVVKATCTSAAVAAAGGYCAALTS
jgi:hypothetical protein